MFADIGSNSEGFYHVGDETMFLATYEWYKKNYPSCRITILSRSIYHRGLKLDEYLHFPYHFKSWREFYFIKFFSKIFLWRIFKIDYFDEEELRLVNVVSSQDIVHFCGGGNLYSIYFPWFYYSLIVMLVARVSRKRLILTSQTIGPLWGVDRLWAMIFLNLPYLIGVREDNVGKFSLINFGVLFPKVVGMLDGAYGFVEKEGKKGIRKKGKLKIGLSIHKAEGYEKKLEQAVKVLLRRLSREYVLEVELIPHVLFKKGEGDLAYMKEMVRGLNLGRRIRLVDEAALVKRLTSSVDLLLTTRYHGAVFGLAANVATIAFVWDSYYRRKNTKVMEFYHENGAGNYLVDLNESKLGRVLSDRTFSIVTNLSQEREKLRVSNSRLRLRRDLFSLDQLKPIFKSVR